MMHPGHPGQFHMMAPPQSISMNMERHIQQTNERLTVIQQQLMAPAGFVSAIRELMEWCSDIRAFQPQYENGLMGCLHVVNRFCASPGFDLQLGYKLLASCFQHRDKLSHQSASFLSQWYEDVRNILLTRNQRMLMNTQPNNMPSHQAALAMAQAAAAHAASQQQMISSSLGSDVPQWLGGTGVPPQSHSQVPNMGMKPVSGGVSTSGVGDGPVSHDGGHTHPQQQQFSVVTTVVGSVNGINSVSPHPSVTTPPLIGDGTPRPMKPTNSTSSNQFTSPPPPLPPSSQTNPANTSLNQLPNSLVPNDTTATAVPPYNNYQSNMVSPSGNVVPKNTKGGNPTAAAAAAAAAVVAAAATATVTATATATAQLTGENNQTSFHSQQFPSSSTSNSTTNKDISSLSIVKVSSSSSIQHPTTPIAGNTPNILSPVSQSPGPINTVSGINSVPPSSVTQPPSQVPLSSSSSSPIPVSSLPSTQELIAGKQQPSPVVNGPSSSHSATSIGQFSHTSPLTRPPQPHPQSSYATPPPPTNGTTGNWPSGPPSNQQVQLIGGSPNPKHPTATGHPPGAPSPGFHGNPYGGSPFHPGTMNGPTHGMNTQQAQYPPRPDNLPLDRNPAGVYDSHYPSPSGGGHPGGGAMYTGGAPYRKGPPPRYGYPSQPSPVPTPSPGFPGSVPSQRYPHPYPSQSPVPQGGGGGPGTPSMSAPPPYGHPGGPPTPSNDTYYHNIGSVPAPSPHNMYMGPNSIQSPPSYQQLPTPISMATGQPMYPQGGVVNSNAIGQTAQQLRLTFPVRDGVLLKPFQLEHGRNLIQVPFHLKESVHEMVLQRNDLEIHFKCYHHDDKQELCNWPQGVSVRINGHPIPIDRGESKHLHKPLHLKQLCQPGGNILEITVTNCCCSHLFVLQLVHRPSVPSVLQGLLRKRLLPVEHCIAKIKKWFQSNNNEDGVQQTSAHISLKCPITFRRIQLPARGAECKHIQCFDLQSYLQMNCDRGMWRCPVCNSTAQLEGLEVDHYIWGILSQLESNTEVGDVTIDPSANWKAVEKTKDNSEEENGSKPKKVKLESESSVTESSTTHTTKDSKPSKRKQHVHDRSRSSSQSSNASVVPSSVPHTPVGLPSGPPLQPVVGPPSSVVNPYSISSSNTITTTANATSIRGHLTTPPVNHTTSNRGVAGGNSSFNEILPEMDDSLDNLKDLLDNIDDPSFFQSIPDELPSNEQILSILEN